MSIIEDALKKAGLKRGDVPPPGSVRAENVAGRQEKGGMTAPVYELNGPHLVSSRLVAFTEPASPLTEQYKKLRAHLLRATGQDTHNTVLVTSTLLGEGKSTTAMNLAISVAEEIHRSVLLVDSDMRKPAIHKYFGIQPEWGLSDYLTGRCDISQIFVRTSIPKLTIVPAGKTLSNSAEWLASDRMKFFLQDISTRYDNRYVILDCAPVAPVTDAVVLSTMPAVDKVLFVAQTRKAGKKEIAHAIGLLPQEKLLGVVLNNVDEAALRYSTYTYPYSYYGEAKETMDIKDGLLAKLRKGFKHG